MFEIRRNATTGFKVNDDDGRVASYVDHLTDVKQSKTQSTDDYWPFVDALPRMVFQSNEKFEFSNATRLTQLKGKIPYLPCTVKLYSKEDIQTCVDERHRKNKSFHVVFFGDSKMRNKFVYLLNVTDSLFNWRVNINGVEETFTFVDYFNNLVKYLRRDLNAVTASDFKLSYIAGDFGLSSLSPTVIQTIFNWSNDKEPNEVPDAIIVDYGIWDIFSPRNPYLYGVDSAFVSWQLFMKSLSEISRRVPVILQGQSRSRSMRNILYLIETKPNLSKEYLKRVLIHDALKTTYADLLDSIKLITSEGSEAIFWDSTVPFNLASERECKELLQANHSSVFEESKDRKPFRRLMCHDSFHKTESTMHDEIAMLLNMLCNEHMLSEHQSYCC